MKLTAYETFCLFLALKNHFTQKNYDFIKYHGKVTVSKDSFAMRKDRLQFQRLSRRYHAEELKEFLIANFIKGRVWAVDLLSEEAEEDYAAYMKRKQAISYTFAEDLDKLFSETAPEQVFRVGNNVPPVLTSFISERISPETFTILDKLTGFTKTFDVKLSDDFLWQKYQTLPRKLHPFLVYDGNKMKTILKEKLHEYGFSAKGQEKSEETPAKAA